jgi:hypothetical protein
MAVIVIGPGKELDGGMTGPQDADVRLKEQHTFQIAITNWASMQEFTYPKLSSGIIIHTSNQIFLVVPWSTM